MLDIIIPLYNERENLSNVLENIKNQDFDLTKIIIYLIDDCSSEIYDDILSKYQILNIKYFKLKRNVGSGLSRKFGLDNSNSEYIIFIDADDYFYDNKSISILYNNIKDGYDYIAGITYYEKNKSFNINTGDLHGKIYKREFIKKNNINFNNTRFHEDNAFNSLVLLCNPKRKEINDIVYYYKDNKKSITNVSNNIEFQRIEIYIANMRYVIIEAEKRGLDIVLIQNYIIIKVKYFQNLYKCYTLNEKIIFKTWLKKYDINVIKYLNTKDINKVENEILSSKFNIF